MAKCSDVRRWRAAGLGVLCVLLTAGTPALATEVAPTVLDTVRPIPDAIRERIASLLTDTLTALFGADGTLTVEAVRDNPVGVAAQVQTGLNFELEDLGYRLTALTLDATGDQLTSAGTLELVGGGIESVTVALADSALPAFWQSRHEATLDSVADATVEALAPALIGLPVGPRDTQWARRQVEPLWVVPEVLTGAFPEHAVTIEVRVDPAAMVLVELTPREPFVTTFRVEARSDSLLMLTLDPIEELILGHSDLVVGQPVALVQAAQEEIVAEYVALMRQSEPARTYGVTHPRLALDFPDKRQSEVRAIAVVESARVHLRAEAFVDLNNDDRPAEFEALAGWRLGMLEPFVVLNVLTEDVEVRTDIGLALYDGPWFAGGAWDLDEGAPKGFASWSPIPQMRLVAEVYRAEDDGQTQVGVLYQPTQQLGVGAFTDTEGLWWIRTSFRL